MIVWRQFASYHLLKVSSVKMARVLAAIVCVATDKIRVEWHLLESNHFEWHLRLFQILRGCIFLHDSILSSS